jgi:hypothetical protein
MRSPAFVVAIATTVVVVVASLTLPAPVQACDSYPGIPGLYLAADAVTGTGPLVRLELVGEGCVMVATLLNDQQGSEVLAGLGFTLPELFGCVEYELGRATDAYKVLRDPVAEVAAQTHLEPRSCGVSVNCNTGPGLPYHCGPGGVRFGTLMKIRD